MSNVSVRSPRVADLDGLRAPLGFIAVGLTIIGAYFMLPHQGGVGWQVAAKVGLYLCVSVGTVVVLVVGIRRHRPVVIGPWRLFVIAQLFYASADTTFYVRHDILGWTAFPSVSDLLYLLHYVPMIAAITWLIRVRTPGRDIPALLDGATLATGGAMLAWVFWLDPTFDADGLTFLGKATSLAFPVMDLAVLAVALRLVLGAGARTRSFYFLISSLSLLLVTDTTYGLQQVAGTYTAGNFLDALWLGSYLCLGAAALDPSMRRLTDVSPVRDELAGPLRVAVLATAAMTAPAALVTSFYLRHDIDVLVIAVCSAILFLLVLARLVWIVHEQRRAAIIDRLTGLHNRGFLEQQLVLEASRATRRHEPVGLLLVDIDRFKLINDVHGHAAGDRVLCQFAARLRRFTRGGDVVARHGGEEFAVLMPGTDAPGLARLAERLRAAISGVPFQVTDSTWIALTASTGGACVPDHGTSATDLLHVADRALYAAKHAGRDRIILGHTDAPVNSRAVGADAILDHLRVLADRLEGYQAPHEHGTAIGRWAEALAQHVNVDDDACHVIAIAGRLHDIGKISVPEYILTKAGRLTDLEWDLIRRHPDQGALLVSTLPDMNGVGLLIAQHHERHDGTGYPRGLRGGGIALGARIIAVCDAFAAMRVDRPYRGALPEDRALDELQRGKGCQFDPDVADLFIDLLDRGIVGRVGHLIDARVPEQRSSSADVSSTR